MSDEQLQTLGLPRRDFLKKAAAGVFVAPLIVSFGLGGTAEAAPGCFPNQTYANQQATQLNNLVLFVWNRENQSLVDHDFAAKIRGELLEAEGDLLDGDLLSSCQRLDQFQRVVTKQAGHKIDQGLANQLVSQVHNLWTQMGCASCTQ